MNFQSIHEAKALPEVDIRIGDARTLAMELEDNSIDCIITSPPYLWLRSYYPDCVKLRRNLTNEELAYVISELVKFGVNPVE